MNKLLQRLPDSSREEVRNQAIVLVQQLTAHNEEMKKTVVFNEVRPGASFLTAPLFLTLYHIAPSPCHASRLAQPFL
jgi:hypothetical protein